MQSIGLKQWLLSVPDAVSAMFGGSIHLRRDGLGRALTMSDGRTYVPFRETIKDAPTDHPVVLQPRFHLRGFGPNRRIMHAIFRRVCIVTTPFFVGLSGYRSKLWMVDPATGDFAGLYEWNGVEEARAYADGLAKILRLLSSPGSVSYELVDDMRVADYLAANAPPETRSSPAAGGNKGVPAAGGGYSGCMTDPRNIAHDKKVASDKAAHGEDIAPGADETPQPGKKPHMEHHEGDGTQPDATVGADEGR
jgi:hypothetical protein